MNLAIISIARMVAAVALPPLAARIISISVLGGVMLFTAIACPIVWEETPYRHREIRNAQYPIPPLWSPDGAHIVFNAGATMHIVEAWGANLRSFPSGKRDLSLTHAASVSLEGIIAFTHESSPMEVRSASFSGRELSRITKQISSDSMTPIWSPDGSKIALFIAWRLAVIDLDSLVHKFIVVPHRDVILETNDPPVWSPDGRDIAFIAEQKNEEGLGYSDSNSIYVISMDGSSLQRLSDTVSLPAWSPDGGRVAFVWNDRDVSTIYTISSDGTNRQAVASFPDVLPESGGLDHLGGTRVMRGQVSWSPDGSEIRLHQSPFVAVNVDGSNLRIMRGRTDALQSWSPALASWSPDESRIAVYQPRREVRLFTMNADGSNKQSLVRWDSGSEKWVADRRPLDIDGFDWEAYPSAEGER